jgi:hypothetical protein
MNRALVVFAVFVSLTATALLAVSSIPTKVYSQLPPPAQTETPAIEGFSTYDDPGSLFSIQYPSDWKILSSKVGDVTFTTPFDFGSGRQMSMVIIVVSDTKATTLDQLATEEKLGLEHMPVVKAKVIDESQATLSGLPAHKIVADSTLSSTPLTSIDIITLKNGKEYKVTYNVGQPDDLPIILQMIDSFRITQ